MSEQLLEAVGLTFSYARRPVVRGVSLRARPGEIVALLGPNGSGKSTLLRMLLGQLRGAGVVKWEGREVRTWSGRQLARKVAFLPQHPTSLSGQTVGESIGMGRYPHLGLLGLESAGDVRAVEQAAKALGLESDLGRLIQTLSGGQRQRAYLARCLAQEPSALLLDEPDTFLDLRHSVQLGETLRHLAESRKIAVVMASHDLHLAAAVADRVVLLSDGQVMAEGPPRVVLTPELIQRVYGVPSVMWQHEGHWGIGVVYGDGITPGS